MADRTSVLFLCTGNSCRSQMAEALLRHKGGEEFEALSAGSHPAGFVHELALGALEALGVSTDNLYSKSWDEFAHREVDIVITVCDQAAAQPCPTWPGHPLQAHWPLPDPSFHPGTDQERDAFALRVAKRLDAKLDGLLAMSRGLSIEEKRLYLTRLGEI